MSFPIRKHNITLILDREYLQTQLRQDNFLDLSANVVGVDNGQHQTTLSPHFEFLLTNGSCKNVSSIHQRTIDNFRRSTTYTCERNGVLSNVSTNRSFRLGSNYAIIRMISADDLQYPDTKPLTNHLWNYMCSTLRCNNCLNHHASIEIIPITQTQVRVYWLHVKFTLNHNGKINIKDLVSTMILHLTVDTNQVQCNAKDPSEVSGLPDMITTMYEQLESFVGKEHRLSIVSAINSVVSLISSIYIARNSTNGSKKAALVAIFSNLTTIIHNIVEHIPDFNYETLSTNIQAFVTNITTSVQANAISVTGSSILAGVIAIIFAGLTTMDFVSAKTLVEKTHLLKAGSEVHRIGKNLLSGIASLFQEYEELSVFTKLDQLQTLSNRMSELIAMTPRDYVENSTYYEELVHMHEKVTKALSHMPKDLDDSQNYRALSSTLVTQISQLNTKKAGLRFMESPHLKFNTMPILFTGKPGVGKTHMVSELPKFLKPSTNFNTRIYQMAQCDENTYANVYTGQDHARKEEFLARKKEDPLLRKFNDFCSENAFSLQGAALDEKKQFVNFKTLLLTSNLTDPNLTETHRGVVNESDHAMWSRIYWFEVFDPMWKDRTSERTPEWTNHFKPDYSHLYFIQHQVIAGKKTTLPQKLTFEQMLKIVSDELLARKAEYYKSLTNAYPDMNFIEQPTVRKELSVITNANGVNNVDSVLVTRIQGIAGSGKTTFVTNTLVPFLLDHTDMVADFFPDLNHPCKSPRIYIFDDKIPPSRASHPYHSRYLSWFAEIHPDSMIIIATNDILQPKRNVIELVKGAIPSYKFECPDSYTGYYRRIGISGQAFINDSHLQIVNNSYCVNYSISRTTNQEGQAINATNLPQFLLNKWESSRTSPEQLTRVYVPFVVENPSIFIKTDTFESITEIFQMNGSQVARMIAQRDPKHIVYMDHDFMSKAIPNLDYKNVFNTTNISIEDDDTLLKLLRYVTNTYPAFTLSVHTSDGDIMYSNNKYYKGEKNFGLIITQNEGHYEISCGREVISGSIQEISHHLYTQYDNYSRAFVKKVKTYLHTLNPSINRWTVVREAAKVIVNKSSEKIAKTLEKPTVKICLAVAGIAILLAGGAYTLYQLFKTDEPEQTTTNAFSTKEEYEAYVKQLKKYQSKVYTEGFKTYAEENRSDKHFIAISKHHENYGEDYGDRKNYDQSRHIHARAEEDIYVGKYHYANSTTSTKETKFCGKITADTIGELLKLDLDKNLMVAVLAKEDTPLTRSATEFLSLSTPVQVNEFSLAQLHNKTETPIEQFARMLRRNTVIVSTNTGECYGLAIRDRRIITVNHPFVDSPNAFYRVSFTVNNIEYSSPAQILFRKKEQDLVVIELTDKTVPSFPDITNHFAESSDIPSISRCKFFRPNINGGCTISSGVCLYNPETEPLTAHNSTNYALSKNYFNFLDDNYTAPNQFYKEGDCGLPLLYEATRNVFKICAIHNAFNSMKAFFSAVSKNEILPTVSTNAKTSNPTLHNMAKIRAEMELYVDPIVTNIISASIPSNKTAPGVKVLGFNRKLCDYESKNPEWTTNLGDAGLIHPIVKHPACMHARNVMDTSALYQNQNGTHDILWTQVCHYSKGTSYTVSDLLVTRAYNFILKRNLDIYGQTRTLRVSEIINGITNRRDPCFGHFNRMKMDASAGPLYQHLNQAKIKHDFFKCDLTTNFYTLDNTPGANHLRNRFEQRVELGSKGISMIGFAKAKKKQELLPEAKVSKGNTRLYTIFDTDLAMHQMKFVGYFNAQCILHHLDAYTQMGIIPYEEFPVLAHRLRRITNGKAIPGDGRKFDKKYPADITFLFYHMLFHMLPSTEQTDDIYKEMMAVAFASAHYYGIAEGTIFVPSNGNASGRGDTTSMNGFLVQMITVSYVVHLLHETHKLPYDMITHDMINEAFDLIDFGDDNYPVIAGHLEPTTQGMIDMWAQYGMEWTPTTKDDNIESTDTTFISRNFSHLRPFTPPGLKKESIVTMYHYVSVLDADLIVEIFSAAQKEASLWEEQFYNEVNSDIQKQVKKLKNSKAVAARMQYPSFAKFRSMWHTYTTQGAAFPSFSRTGNVILMKQSKDHSDLTEPDIEYQHSHNCIICKQEYTHSHTKNDTEHINNCQSCTIMSNAAKNYIGLVKEFYDQYPEYKKEEFNIIDLSTPHCPSFEGRILAVDPSSYFYSEVGSNKKEAKAKCYKKLWEFIETTDAFQKLPQATSDIVADSIELEVTENKEPHDIAQDKILINRWLAIIPKDKIRIVVVPEMTNRYKLAAGPRGYKLTVQDISFIHMDEILTANSNPAHAKMGNILKPNDMAGGTIEQHVNMPTTNVQGVNTAAPTPLEGGNAITAPGMTTMPTNPQLSIANQNSGGDMLFPGLPGPPNMAFFNMNVRKFESYTTQPFESGYEAVNGNAVAGTVLLDIPYGPNSYLNPYASAYLALHENYAGGFVYEISKACLPIVRGQMFAAIVRKPLPVGTTVINLAEMQPIKYYIFEASAVDVWTVLLTDARKNTFYRSTDGSDLVSDPPPHLIIGIYTPFVNQFQDSDNTVIFHIRSSLAGPEFGVSACTPFEPVAPSEIVPRVTAALSSTQVSFQNAVSKFNGASFNELFKSQFANYSLILDGSNCNQTNGPTPGASVFDTIAPAPLNYFPALNRNAILLAQTTSDRYCYIQKVDEGATYTRFHIITTHPDAPQTFAPKTLTQFRNEVLPFGTFLGNTQASGISVVENPNFFDAYYRIDPSTTAWTYDVEETKQTLYTYSDTNITVLESTIRGPYVGGTAFFPDLNPNPNFVFQDLNRAVTTGYAGFSTGVPAECARMVFTRSLVPTVLYTPGQQLNPTLHTDRTILKYFHDFMVNANRTGANDVADFEMVASPFGEALVYGRFSYRLNEFYIRIGLTGIDTYKVAPSDFSNLTIQNIRTSTYGINIPFTNVSRFVSRATEVVNIAGISDEQLELLKERLERISTEPVTANAGLFVGGAMQGLGNAFQQADRNKQAQKDRDHQMAMMEGQHGHETDQLHLTNQYQFHHDYLASGYNLTRDQMNYGYSSALSSQTHKQNLDTHNQIHANKISMADRTSPHHAQLASNNSNANPRNTGSWEDINNSTLEHQSRGSEDMWDANATLKNDYPMNT